MTTYIKEIRNLSDVHAAMVNRNYKNDTRLVAPHETLGVDARNEGRESKALVLFTKKGCLFFWDDKNVLHGHWEGQPTEYEIIPEIHQWELRLTIDKEGEVTGEKL